MKKFFIYFVFIAFILGCNSQKYTEKMLNDGNNFLYNGNFVEAEKIYQKILKKDKNNFQSLFNLAAIHALENKHEQAVEEFSKLFPLAKNLSDTAFVYFNLAGLYSQDFFEKNDTLSLKKAISNFQNAATFQNYFVVAYDCYMQGSMILGMLKTGKEQKDLKFTLDESTYTPDSKILLAQSNFSEVEGRKVVIFDKSVPMIYFYNSPNCLLIKGLSLLRNGAYAEALKNYEDLIFMLPSFKSKIYDNDKLKYKALIGKGSIYLQTKDFNKVEPIIKELNTIKTEELDHKIFEMSYYYTKEDYKEAKRVADEILAKDKDNMMAKQMKDFNPPQRDSNKVYQNKEYKISFDKPSDWITLDKNTNVEQYNKVQKSFREPIIALFMKGISDTDPFFYVKSTIITKPITLEEFKDYIEKSTNDPRISFPEKTEIVTYGENKFVKSIHKLTQGNIEIYFISFNTIKGNKLYTIQAQLFKEDYQSLKETIFNVAKTFKIS